MTKSLDPEFLKLVMAQLEIISTNSKRPETRTQARIIVEKLKDGQTKSFEHTDTDAA